MSALPEWFLRMSWQASVLTAIVLAVQWIFRGKLSARWQYAFWFLVLARLALPLPPSSPLSLFNYVGTKKIAAEAAAEPIILRPASLASHRSPPDVGTVERTERPTPAPSRSPNQHSAVSLPAVAQNWFRRENAMTLGMLIWVAGTIIFGGRLIRQNLSFRHLLGTPADVADPETLALFARCRAELGVTARIRLSETELVRSPALYGFARPRLLLPTGILGRLSGPELRHVFLHELAHVKRRDMFVLALVTFWKMLHWFNPVLWFGFRRMAEDRELACDELALTHAGEHERGQYGETILKLLESYTQPAMAPGLMGILEDKSQIRRRILSIAKFKSRTRWSAPAALLLLAMGLVTLTDAQPENPMAIRVQASLRGARTNLDGAMADLAAARDAFEQGVNILQLLAAAEPGNADWHHDLNDSFENLNDALLARGNYGEAGALMEQGIKILRKAIDYLYAPAPNHAAQESNFSEPWDD